MGEVTITGATEVREVTAGGERRLTWQPADFGLPAADKKWLTVDGPKMSAQIVLDVLGGKKSPCRDIVVMNAAAALWVAGAEPSIGKCAERAAEAIDSRAAKTLLDRLAEASR